MELIDVSENEEFVCKVIHINSVLKNENFECAARVAQLVERLTCNEDVAGSTPVSGSILEKYLSGGVPEWSKGTDCKSVGEAFGGSNPPPTTILNVSRL
jgi:hypothetical protein